MPTKLAKITNNIFKFIAFFCLSFIWINYYYHKFLPSVIYSIIISSAICAILTIIDSKKSDKQKIKANKIKQAHYALTQLKFYTYKESLNFVNLALDVLNYKPKINKEFITVNNTLVIPCFNKPLSEEAFISMYNIFKSSNYKKLIIFTITFDNHFELFINNFNLENIEIISGEQLYLKIIEPSNVKIENKIEFKETKKLKLIELKNIVFNRSRAKGYFLSGFILLFTSLFYPYGLYYQIFASILFCLSLFSFYNKKYNVKPSDNLFE